MELLFIFLLGFAFTYMIQIFDMILQWFQMWVSVKVSVLQVKINKLAIDEQQGQEETYAVGFHYSEPEQEFIYEDDEEFDDDVDLRLDTSNYPKYVKDKVKEVLLKK